MKTKLFFLFGILFSTLAFSQSDTTISITINYGYIEEDNVFYHIPLEVNNIGIIDDRYGLKKVCVDIEDDEDGQLAIYLKSPNGQLIELSTYNGGNGNDYGNTCFTMGASDSITQGTPGFYGDFIPEGHLDRVNNFQNANGIWHLLLKDSNGDDNSNIK